MMLSKEFKFLSALTVTALLLTGCKSAPPPPPAALPPSAAKVVITTTADVNPNRAGRASPIRLHLYQLRDAVKFQSVSFDELSAKSEQTLAAALLKSEQRTMQPNDGTTFDWPLEAPAQFIGVVAEYADLGVSRWRVVGAAPEGGFGAFHNHVINIVLNAQGAAINIESSGAIADEKKKGFKIPGFGKKDEAPKLPNIPKIPEVPKLPSAPKAPEAPKAPDAPKLPTTPTLPRAP
jgi:type VI secretion system protein VasD